MHNYQGCNRIVQYSVGPNTICQIVDIRFVTEYQCSVFGQPNITLCSKLDSLCGRLDMT